MDVEHDNEVYTRTTSYDTVIDHPTTVSPLQSHIISDENSNLNQLNLAFSRKHTDLYDRKKVEIFWSYFDANPDLGVALKNSIPLNNTENSSLTRKSQLELETHPDPYLCGTITHCEGELVTSLKMIKSRGLDKVALANAPPVKKIEGSPVLADEIIQENKDSVLKEIQEFEEGLPSKIKPITKDMMKRDSLVKINRLGLKYILG